METPSGRPLDRRGGILPAATVLVLLAATIAAPFAWREYRARTIADNERRASALLKTLAAAEADFRAHDRDGNQIHDFWTGDVRSLYDLVPIGSTDPILLIERPLALADPSQPGARPYHGYWFVAMDQDEDGMDYRTDTKGRGTAGQRTYNTSKFAFCAYPAEYGYTGRSTFFLNEIHMVIKEDREGRPGLRWASDRSTAFPKFQGR